MSRSELTDAYVSGRISRRSFVRGMIALGCSVPVAMALADKVWASPSTARSKLQRSDYNDVYPDPYPWPPRPPKAKIHAKTQPLSMADQDKSSLVAPLAAGAAAAALVALRMRRLANDQSQDDQGES